MKRSRKIAVGAAGAALVLAAVVLLLALLAPRLIDSAALQERLLALASRETGGQVTWERLELAWFPRPRAVVRRATIRLPGKLDATVEAAAIYPRLLPLLRGRVRLARLRLDAPSFAARLPERIRMPGEKPPTLAAVEEGIAALLARLAAGMPGLVVEAEKGRLDLRAGEKALISLRDVRLRASLPPKAMAVDLTGRTDLGERVALGATLDPEGFRGEGTLSVEGFRAGPLLSRLVPGAPWGIGEEPLDGRVRIAADGIGTLRAEAEAAAPSLSIRREGRRWLVRSARLAGGIRAEKGRTALSLADLALDSPRVALSGTAVLDPAAPRAGLDLSVREADLSSLREAALALAGDLPPVRKVFEVVREGRLFAARVRSGGRSPAELGALGNVVAEGRLENGRIVVPGIGLDLRSVRGEAALSGGVLSGKNAEARVGRASGRGGTLRLGLSGKGAPLHVDVRIDADLSELPPFLLRVVPAPAFRKEMSLVEGVDGRATGRLVLDGKTDAVRTRVEVWEMRLSGRYARVPFPIRVDRGRFSYDPDRVTVEDLGGQVGESGFDGLSARIALGGEEARPVLESLAGDFSLRLGELFPWVASLEGTGRTLKNIRTLEGDARLRVASLRAPLTAPGAIAFDASGEVRGLASEAPWWPGTLRVTEGTFRAGPGRISLAGVSATLLDASLRASGEIRGYGEEVPEVDLVADGEVGAEGNRWLSDLAGLPEELRLRSPLTLSRFRVVRKGDGATTAKGRIRIHAGPEIALDLDRRRRVLDVKSLSIRDEDSQATLSLRRGRRRLAVAFAGRLTDGTLQRALATSEAIHGELEGELRAAFPLDRPVEAVVQGRLEGRGIVLPPRWIGPARIETISLEAERGAVKVASAELTWLGQRFSLSGEAHVSAEGVRLDVDLAAGGVDADRILEILKRRGAAEGGDGDGAGGEEEAGPERPGGAKSVAVEGVVRLRAEALRWGRTEWKPLHADLVLARRSVKAEVKRAELCGLSAAGAVAVEAGRVSLDLGVVSEGREIGATLACLEQRQYGVSGKFRFEGRVAGTGTKEELFEALRGDFVFSAEDGRIHRFNLLAKILAVVNLTEIVRGKLPDLGKGIAYNTVTIKGALQDGRLAIRDEATLDGASMGIVARGEVDVSSRKVDMVVLVSPFRTVDYIIRKIPVVRYILGGRLVAVPVRVRGDLDDPDVAFMPPSEVGSGILGILERTLKAPIRLIEPLFPGGKAGGEPPAGR